MYLACNFVSANFRVHGVYVKCDWLQIDKQATLLSMLGYTRWLLPRTAAKFNQGLRLGAMAGYRLPAPVTGHAVMAHGGGKNCATKDGQERREARLERGIFQVAGNDV